LRPCYRLGARVADGTPRFPDGSTKVHASAMLAF